MLLVSIPKETPAMKKGALLGTCLALPLAGLAVPALAGQPGCAAAQPEGLTVFQPAAIELHAEHMIATADAMFREMNAEMNAMQAQMAALMQAPMPGPQQFIEATFGPGHSVPLGTAGATVISITTGVNGTCSETITYSYPGNANRPVVHVAEGGNACGAIHVNGAAAVQMTRPVQRQIVPRRAIPEHGPQLIEAYYQPAGPRG
jgi:hypothetical protein